MPRSRAAHMTGRPPLVGSPSAPAPPADGIPSEMLNIRVIER